VSNSAPILSKRYARLIIILMTKQPVLDFQKLELKDKERLEAFVKDYLPFSDFSFLSLFTYNTKGGVEYCFLNGNLVVKFEDYVTGENFYSLIGKHKLHETIDTLLAQAKKDGLQSSLNLVPHSVLEHAPDLHERFTVEEDKDNFDYIVSSLDLAELHPEKLPKKRKLIEDFRQAYPDLSVRPIDLTDPKNQAAILQMCEDWRVINKKDKTEIEAEFSAIKRLLKNAHHFPNLYAVGVYDKDKLVAFNTYEVATHGHGISSFQKADRKYRGIYAFLTHEMAKSMHELGCQYINFEQDLGIEGLRSSKASWHPVNFLKKYKVSHRPEH